MASYVYVKNPNGTTYVYENVSYWDKVTKSTKHKRKCVGKLKPGTREIVPTKSKSTATSEISLQESRCTVTTIGPSLLLDKAASETKLAQTLHLTFPDDWGRILTCAYYLACEGNALCHIEQWSSCNQHPFGARLADQRVSELLHRLPPLFATGFF